MNATVIISRERLHPNPANPLPPLTETEFADLRNSIEKYGIIEPLMVIRNDKNPNDYVVIVGNHRLKAAKELGISEISCTLIQEDETDAAYQTELYRRTLSPEERRHYAQKIREASDRKREERIKESLINELYSLYETGKWKNQQVTKIINLSKDEQRELYQTMREGVKIVSPIVALPEKLAASSPSENHQAQREAEEKVKASQKALEQANQKYAQLESTLKKMEKAKEDLERRNREAQRLLKDKTEELKDVKEQSMEDAAEKIKGQVEKRIADVQEQIAKSSMAIKEKDRELEILREERDKAKRDLKTNEAKLNTVWFASRAYYDQCKTAMNLIFRPDLLRKRVANIKSEMEMLETVWNSYDIDERLKDEIYEEVKIIRNKVQDLLETLPQIRGPQLPAITAAMFNGSKMDISEAKEEVQLLQ